MRENADLVELMAAIPADPPRAIALLAGAPDLAIAALRKAPAGAEGDEFFLEPCRTQVYAGDTALHVAAAAHRLDMAHALVAAGAAVDARNRRGARPLHSAVRGEPGSPSWDPTVQVAVMTFLIAEGAEVDAAAAGGVTPLHRAVRNRCSAAVAVLLDAGADPNRPNDAGSTALDLTRWTTGRGGSGSAAARAELDVITRLLEPPDDPAHRPPD